MKKITYLNGDFSLHKLITLDTFVKRVKYTPPTRMQELFKTGIPFLSPTSTPSDTDKLPAVIFSSGYRDHQWLHYNGLVLIEFNRLPSQETALLLRNRIIAYRQPFLVFTGVSGISVKVVVPYTLPDNTLPATEEAAKLFHAYAFRHAAIHYREQFGYPVAMKEPVLNKICRIPSDPGCFYNPEALPVKIELPGKAPVETDFRISSTQAEDPLAGLMPGLEQYEKMQLLFETCLRDVLEKVQNSGTERDDKQLIVDITRNCFRSGIEQENTVRWIYGRTLVNCSLDTIRQTVHNIYLQEKDFGKRPVIPAPMNLTHCIIEFLKRRYEFRKNQIHTEIEYRERTSFAFHFRPVTPEVLNQICLEARKEGIDAWDKDIKRYVYSLSVEEFNPVDEFFKNLPTWDNTDHIRALARTVPNRDPEWENRFYKWFVSMVAHWKKPDQEFGNTLVPVLTGGQGARKSAFFRRLLPPELRSYYMEDINPENQRDTQQRMAQNLLIVIDEFDRINARDQAQLKHLIQLPQVKIKKPYKKIFELIPRMASFAAIANPTDLLADVTGSRRYICVEVTGLIDIDTPVNYSQLYAQAIHAFNSGERYWMDEDEEKALQKDNLPFQQLSLEMQYLFTYFRKPEPGERAELYTAMELLDHITQLSKRKFANTSSIGFARQLNHSGIGKSHKKDGNYYHLIRKDPQK